LWGGHGIAAFDLSIGVSPRRGRPYYLAAFATAGGVGFAAASIVAGLLASTLAGPLHAAGSAWSEMHVLFLLSAIGRGAAAALAVRIGERLGLPAGSLVPQTIAYATLGVAVAGYEQWLADESADLLELLDAAMRELAASFTRV
jgi:hypothetical protein